MFNHSLQIDAFREKATDGRRFPLTDKAKDQIIIRGYDTQRVEKINEILVETYLILDQLPQIKTLFIPMQKDVFYLLEPEKIRGRKIVILPSPYGPIAEAFGGSLYGMHTEGEQYSYYYFLEKEGTIGTLPGLYLGDLSGCVGCYYFHRNDEFGSYLLFYGETREPLRVPEKDEFMQMKLK